MPARRPPDFSLEEAARSPAFTPGRKDVSALLDLVASEDEALAEDAERALTRAADAAFPVARARLADAKPPVRGRLARLIGRLARTVPAAREALVGLLEDADAKTRRNAVLALGKAGTAADEAPLLAYWEREARTDHRRSIAEALGKIGGPKSLAVLRGVATDDAELRRILDVAVLRLSRTLDRPDDAPIDPSVAASEAVPILLHCRPGLEGILAGDLGGAWQTRVVARGLVRAVLHGPLGDVFRARTWLRLGFDLGETRGTAEEVAVAALTSAAARRVFATWTRGPIRYRIAWSGGGHRRAAVLRIAHAVASRRPDLVNDPTESPWEAVISEHSGAVRVELVPKGLADPRFAYRGGDVPAASHPTIAAALVRVAGVQPDDVVWDPFVGSGLELCERALAGPYRALHGSDHDPRAIEIARANLAAAGAKDVTLTVAEASHHRISGVTLVLTNPPMGRRQRGDVGPLLDALVMRASAMLAPGGRMAWLTPLPERTTPVAKQHGFEPTFQSDVDVGGFNARLQLLSRRG